MLLLPDRVMFECNDADLICHAAKQTKGSAGPSGLNAHAWQRMCCSFKDAFNDLCHSLALLARRLCTQFIHPLILAPLLACQLFALDKNPGIRPIGVCEVARRIIKVTSKKQPDVDNSVVDRWQALRLLFTQSDTSLRTTRQKPFSWLMSAMRPTA